MQQFDDAASITLAIVIVVTVGFVQEYRYTVVFVHLISYCSLQLDSSRNTGTQSPLSISFVIVPYSWLLPGIQVHSRLRPSHLLMFVTVGFFQEYRYTVVVVHLNCFLQLDSSRNTGSQSSSVISFVIVRYSWNLPGIQTGTMSSSSVSFVIVRYSWNLPGIQVHGRLRSSHCYCTKHLSNIVLIEYVLKEGRG